MMHIKRKGDLYNYRIFETNQFISDIEKIQKNIGQKIYNKIQQYVYPQLQLNPYYGKNVKKLVNYKPPTWRYRIGKYRIFYEIDEKEKIVFIITIEIRHKA
ncbi:MAG: type II toxin-antitoxin system RelE/ParE family toxin [Spirochaetota bacterium]